MKSCLLLLVYLLIFGCRSQKSVDGVQEKPNILFIFIDDLGWPAIESYGNQHVKTPHINRIGEEGIRFTNAYVTPQCTPSRASLLTGQHTAINTMWHVIPGYSFPNARMREPEYIRDLPRETYTIGEALKDNGYTTAMLGKWHLSIYENDGYYTRLFDSAKVHYGFDYVDRSTGEYQGKGDKGVDMLTDEAIGFMKNNQENEKPFFIYLSHHTIHGPVIAPENLVNKYKEKGYPEDGLFNVYYLAALEHLDNSVGRLFSAMDEMSILENTVVIFLSDNGGVDKFFDNAPLRWGKGAPYEGGIRVPFMVRYPKKFKKGIVSELPVHVIDMYPTLVDIGGGEMKMEHQLDGLSLLPHLREGKNLERDVLFWYTPLYDPQWGAVPSAIIRKGDYKLIKFYGDYIEKEKDLNYLPEGRVELYNLKEDIGESKDLVNEMPEKAKNLERELDDWLVSTGVALPTLNEKFDQEKVYERENYRK
ncbi:MAG: sulfatase [Bacteroidota bacterium]